jgi:hypothetical protein
MRGASVAECVRVMEEALDPAQLKLAKPADQAGEMFV